MKLSSQSLQIGPMGSQGIQGPAGPVSGVLVSPLVTLNAAGLLALNTPTALLAGVPGKVIQPIWIGLRYLFGTMPYTDPGPANLGIGYGLGLDFSGTDENIPVDPLLAAANRTWRHVVGDDENRDDVALGQPLALHHQGLVNLVGGDGLLLVQFAYLLM